MSKLLLLSSLVAMIVLPLRASRFDDLGKGLRRTVSTTFLYNVLFAIAVMGLFLLLSSNPESLLPPSVQQGP